MGCGSNIAIIDGEKGLVGYARQLVHGGASKKILTGKEEEKQEALILQLKRETLANCRVGELSGHFSYHESIDGRKVVIWCTGGKGGFQKAFYGTVERVSHKTASEFVLRIERKATPNECYTAN